MPKFDKMQWEATCNSEPANISRCLSTVAPAQYRKWMSKFWWFCATDWSKMSTGQCLSDAFFDFLHCHHSCKLKSWPQASRDRRRYEGARMWYWDKKHAPGFDSSTLMVMLVDWPTAFTVSLVKSFFAKHTWIGPSTRTFLFVIELILCSQGIAGSRFD